MDTSKWLWDRNISGKEIKSILSNPKHERFTEITALLLSRNNTPKEVFDEYLNRESFVQNWIRVRKKMRQNFWNDPRIIFWQAVYEKILIDFKEKGIRVRSVKRQKPDNHLCLKIGEKIRLMREQKGLTQVRLAQKLGVSQQVISRIEQGRDNISVLTLEKVAEGLGGEVVVQLR